ncbi:hypothetical protein DPP32_06865 [Salmonella enterica subsp. enterica serovar Kimberley]|nr:hypothetical protein [Salmonella enterica subsp. enterica serovar Kimberley]
MLFCLFWSCRKKREEGIGNNDIPQVPEFTIGMLIASARAGRWLYDSDSRLGAAFRLSLL